MSWQYRAGVPYRGTWACRAAKHHAANGAIRDALSRSERPYVSVSGGKDSMLMAAMVIEVDPSVPMVHSMSSRSWLPEHWPDVLVDALTRMGATDVRTTRDNMIYADHGYDLVFVGLRRGESQRRARRMADTPQLNPGVPECWPVADYSTKDLWACTAAHGVPYASVYAARPLHQRMRSPKTPMEVRDWQDIHYRFP